MAFLDNSGDILLDAVLTDTGRKRMAEGTFRITKFALADDEIDYSLYNTNDTRGSAYYDLDILSTPILEAFTDNAAGLKSKLLSVGRTDLLYLPTMKLFDGGSDKVGAINNITNSFIVPTNAETLAMLSIDGDSSKQSAAGVLVNTRRKIIIDQGIDNEQMPFNIPIDPSLQETQFIIEIDNRLGVIRNFSNATGILSYAYLDDDQIASYIVTEDNASFVGGLDSTPQQGQNAYPSYTSIKGQFGARLQFSINCTSTLQTSDFLFERLGSVFDPNTLDATIPSSELMYIDANVRVMGATTGYRIDIPVRFVKKAGSTGTL